MATVVDEKRQSRIVTDQDLDGVTGTYLVSQNYAEKAVEDGRSSEELAPGLKTTPDGKIVLIPQPSDDPEDPLNCEH